MSFYLGLLGLTVTLALLSTRPALADPPAAENQPARTDRYGDPLPPGALARLGTQRLCLPGVHFLAISPDGKLLAAGNSGGDVRVWALGTAKEVWRWDAASRGSFPHGWSPLAFSPDSKVLAMVCPDKSVRLWDAGTGRELHRLPYDALPLSVVFDPTGRYLLVEVRGGSIDLRDPAQGRLLGQLGNLRSVSGVAFPADGKALVATRSSQDGRRELIFSLRELASGKEVGQSKVEVDGNYAGALSPDGKCFAAPTGDGKSIRLFDPATGKELRRTPGEADWPAQVAFSGDGRFMTASSRDGIVRVWETATGKRLHQFKGLSTGFRKVALSRDGAVLALFGRADHAVHLWDVRAARELHTFAGHRDGTLTVAFARDGKTLATASRDSIRSTPTREWADWSLRHWDPVTAKELRVTGRNQGGEVRFAAFSPDGSRLATVRHDGILRVWDVSASKELCEWKVPTREIIHKYGGTRVEKFACQAITEPAFSPDNQTLFAGHGGFVLRWEAATGKELPPLKMPQGVTSPRCFPSPDGRVLFANSLGGGKFRMLLLDAASGNVLREIAGRNLVRACAFSPDGKTLAVGDGPAVALWEVGSGHSRGRLEGGPGHVLGMAFSPDGRFLATGRTSGASPQLWHLASGRVVGQIDGRAINWVESLAFSPDGKLLAAGGGDNTVLVCEVAGLLAEKPLAPARLPR